MFHDDALYKSTFYLLTYMCLQEQQKCTQVDNQGAGQKILTMTNICKLSVTVKWSTHNISGFLLCILAPSNRI